MKQTKIIATIGPASQDKKILREMILAGVDVARINFSHGDHQSNGELIKTIKELRAELQKPVGILVDLQGPRIRTLVESDTGIKEGEVVIISDISKKYQVASSKYQVASSK